MGWTCLVKTSVSLFLSPLFLREAKMLWWDFWGKIDSSSFPVYTWNKCHTFSLMFCQSPNSEFDWMSMRRSLGCGSSVSVALAQLLYILFTLPGHSCMNRASEIFTGTSSLRQKHQLGHSYSPEPMRLWKMWSERRKEALGFYDKKTACREMGTRWETFCRRYI